MCAPACATVCKAFTETPPLVWKTCCPRRAPDAMRRLLDERLEPAGSGDEPPDAAAERVPLLLRAVGALRVHSLVACDETGELVREPRHVLLADDRTQVQQDRRDVRRTGVHRGPDDLDQLVRTVRDAREDRGDHHAGWDAGFVQPPDGVDAVAR